MEPKTARSCPNSPKARSELEARDRAPGSSHTLGDTDTHTAPVSVLSHSQSDAAATTELACLIACPCSLLHPEAIVHSVCSAVDPAPERCTVERCALGSGVSAAG
ncbi:hypothetical protein BDP55DRAFT_637500 [Colletotrichum godetiae]|uniref:Uncharacterized protein n=1 Tax=Colletotrichum godetiae TaxID=1209918 RepID=A0AAJ0EPS0_9PEZI|nr:uncharacterized protein BDP55DRAFT_637500 [Colletotrichum godetiae]KAK1658847.1 hypothetical protein BDP55DRAFT_637500 [Colletotrichum godetiae]